jgi:hypothetical protein
MPTLEIHKYKRKTKEEREENEKKEYKITNKTVQR